MEAEKALLQVQDDLEVRVREKTAQLVRACEQLKKKEDRLQHQLKRMRLLNQMTRAMIQRQDKHSLFTVALKYLEDYLSVDFGCVLLLDQDEDIFTVAATGTTDLKLVKKWGMYPGTIIPIDQNGLRRCAEGKAVYEPDISLLYTPALEGLAAEGFRSMVLTPLAVEDEVLGVLLTMRRKPGSFTSGSFEFLQQLAEHVALGAQNAKLYEDLHDACNDLRKTQMTVMRQERLRALGQMASGMAHDINNAVSPILGYTDLLLIHEKGLDEKISQYLTIIRTAGEDIIGIVERMRSFYRTTPESQCLGPLDLNQMVIQAMELAKPRWKDIAHRKGIMIEVKTEPTDPLPLVEGLESEIRQALINLIFNVADAMPGGGVITLGTGISEDDIFLQVKDSGTGMGKQEKDRCLEPFFSTKGAGGTGLGLATVHGIMERHDGEIQIESEPGEGTSVRLLFPISREGDEPVSEISHEMPMPASPMRILAIDDEPALLSLLQGMFETDGHRVKIAYSGAEGLKAFYDARKRGKPFELVVTDLGMPYMDGREVAKHIKAESSDTPVILLTGWGKMLQSEGKKIPHVDVILSKPPRMRELRRAVGDC